MTAAAARGCCATSSSARGGAPASSRCGWSRSPGRARSAGPRRRRRRRRSVLWTRIESVAETTQGGETELLSGTDYLDEELGGMRAADLARGVLPDQHRDGRAAVRGSAIDYAGLRGFERVYDLYCGIGTIGLLMLAREWPSCGASRSWRRRSPTRSPTPLERGRQRPLLRRRRPAGAARAGRRPPAAPTCSSSTRPAPACRQKVVRRIIEAAPRRIVYVSCNPTTLAPNAAQLVEAGYELRRVRPVDMFPQTPHIECVAVLERDGRVRARCAPPRSATAS